MAQHTVYDATFRFPLVTMHATMCHVHYYKVRVYFRHIVPMFLCFFILDVNFAKSKNKIKTLKCVLLKYKEYVSVKVK